MQGLIDLIHRYKQQLIESFNDLTPDERMALATKICLLKECQAEFEALEELTCQK